MKHIVKLVLIALVAQTSAVQAITFSPKKRAAQKAAEAFASPEARIKRNQKRAFAALKQNRAVKQAGAQAARVAQEAEQATHKIVVAGPVMNTGDKRKFWSKQDEAAYPGHQANPFFEIVAVDKVRDSLNGKRPLYDQAIGQDEPAYPVAEKTSLLTAKNAAIAGGAVVTTATVAAVAKGLWDAAHGVDSKLARVVRAFGLYKNKAAAAA